VQVKLLDTATGSRVCLWEASCSKHRAGLHGENKPLVKKEENRKGITSPVISSLLYTGRKLASPLYSRTLHLLLDRVYMYVRAGWPHLSSVFMGSWGSGPTNPTKRWTALPYCTGLYMSYMLRVSRTRIQSTRVCEMSP
jgi:hypothetical protein